MPELAELKLTADYINKSAADLLFVNIRKNPIHKGKEISVPYKKFYISAESRGKELMLLIKDKYSQDSMNLLMTMGMSGHFKFTNIKNEPKHSHLMFFTDCDEILSFVDVRRFGKWKFVNNWSHNRGPDPTKEFEEFKRNIYDVGFGKPVFDQPIHLVLMNQQYFNGIGNYLRSEIIGRIPKLNPFTEAREAIKNHPEILDLCKEIPLKAYLLGGGRLKDWETIFGSSDKDFKNFIQFYGNRERCIPIKDKAGRTFWCDKKWEMDPIQTISEILYKMNIHML